MNKIILSVFILIAGSVYAQDVPVLLKQASNYERFLKEDSALLKYKEVLSAEPNNIQALIKSSVLTAAAGARIADKKGKKDAFEQAKAFAEKAFNLDSTSADANYAMGNVYWKLSQVETENKKITEDLKRSRLYAEKALAINPNHGKANYLLGKWNFEMVNTAWTKKVAVKMLYGGIPDATMENAYKYMEKSRSVEPYFVQNFLDLAKAYKLDNNPNKAIEVLNQLVKLPTRTADDAALKAEGKKILSEMQ